MAGELGATLIVQKEITIPSSPLNVNVLEYGQVDGAPRVPRLVSPPSVHDADVSPMSLTDVEGSGSDDMTGPASSSDKSRAQRPNNATIAAGQSMLSATAPIASNPTISRSSPQPIIRDYPYGFNAWGYSRTPSSSHLSTSSPPGTSTSLPTFSEVDSDVDDDAAFAFDLNISNFSARSGASPSSKTIIFAEETDALFSFSGDAKLAQSQRLHRQIKHKKPKMLRAPAIDPAEKARQRRVRRESNRERKRPTIEKEEEAESGVLSNGAAVGAYEPEITITNQDEENSEGKGTGDLSVFGTPFSLSTQLTLSDDVPSEETGPQIPSREDGNASAPRLIAEALIVRKFTVEVEEQYLDFDKLRL